jgi:hypothetical protein
MILSVGAMVSAAVMAVARQYADADTARHMAPNANVEASGGTFEQTPSCDGACDLLSAVVEDRYDLSSGQCWHRLVVKLWS